jgi:magnesium-transporting ATPase (P-type)
MARPVVDKFEKYRGAEADPSAESSRVKSAASEHHIMTLLCIIVVVALAVALVLWVVRPPFVLVGDCETPSIALVALLSGACGLATVYLAKRIGG